MAGEAESPPDEARYAEPPHEAGSDAPTASAADDDDGEPPAPREAARVVEALPPTLRAVDRQLAECIASLEQSHVQLAQSRPDSKLPSSVSQTTRNIMAKRALAQLDEVGGALGGARAELSGLAHAAGSLANECATLARERDAALATAQRALAESAALAQFSQASQAELSSRAEAGVRTLSDKLESTSAEARLLQQLNDKLRAESEGARNARDAAEARAAAAEAAAAASADAAGGESGLRARDRSLLARLAAENAVFVAQLRRARAEGAALLARAEGAERERDERLAAALAAQRDELQAALLHDWGTSAGLEASLAEEQTARERTEHAAREEARLLGERAAELQAALRDSEGRRADAERALGTALEEVGLASAGMRHELHSAARADAAARAARERLAALEARDAGHAEEAASLRVAAADALGARDDAEARAAQLAEQLAGVLERERTGRRVGERLREEATREHTRLLELEAKLDDARARAGAAEHERALISAQLGAVLAMQQRPALGPLNVGAGVDEPAAAERAGSRKGAARAAGARGRAAEAPPLPEPLPLGAHAA